MRKMKKYIDVWNLIDKYQIEGWVEEADAILIPEAEFQRLLGAVKNRRYVLNLKK